MPHQLWSTETCCTKKNINLYTFLSLLTKMHFRYSAFKCNQPHGHITQTILSTLYSLNSCCSSTTSALHRFSFFYNYAGWWSIVSCSVFYSLRINIMILWILYYFLSFFFVCIFYFNGIFPVAGCWPKPGKAVSISLAAC